MANMFRYKLADGTAGTVKLISHVVSPGKTVVLSSSYFQDRPLDTDMPVVLWGSRYNHLVLEMEWNLNNQGEKEMKNRIAYNIFANIASSSLFHD